MRTRRLYAFVWTYRLCQVFGLCPRLRRVTVAELCFTKVHREQNASIGRLKHVATAIRERAYHDFVEEPRVFDGEIFGAIALTVSCERVPKRRVSHTSSDVSLAVALVSGSALFQCATHLAVASLGSSLGT